MKPPTKPSEALQPTSKQPSKEAIEILAKMMVAKRARLQAMDELPNRSKPPTKA